MEKQTQEKIDEEVNEWQEYWGSKSLKRTTIEFFREKWFARIFVNLVKKFNKPKGNVLEAGCGSGAYGKFMKDIYHGCDLSPKALKIASRNIPKNRLKLGNIFSLPYKDNSFSLIFNQGVMEHFNDKEINSILTEFKRVSGKILIMVPSKYSIFRIWNPFEEVSPRFFSKKELVVILKRAGYSNIKSGYIVSTFLLTVFVYGERKDEDNS